MYDSWIREEPGDTEATAFQIRHKLLSHALKGSGGRTKPGEERTIHLRAATPLSVAVYPQNNGEWKSVNGSRHLWHLYDTITRYSARR